MAKTIVIFPGGFHPPHAGHVASYNALKKAFPGSEAFMASTGYTAERPFPFEKKKALAIAAGIPKDSFVEVKSPYVAIEITKKFDKEKDFLVFGVSEKDADRFTYTKKDGSPGYFQKWTPDVEMVPFAKHAYIYITPILEFKVAGKIVTSASAIRKMYKDADEKTKKIILKDLYPNANLEDVKDLFDEVLKEVYMPKKYRAGLSKSTAGKRKRFWVKLGKYPYTKAEYSKAEKVPGDAKSETRPSQYNKKYQQMFGESRSIKALQKKAKATGIPYGILKQVYNRGMAAWVTGHRPGASQSAWAFARVNSFVTKGKTWRTADADLAKKARKYLNETEDFDVAKFRGTFGLIDPNGKEYYPKKDSDQYHRHLLKYTNTNKKNSIEDLLRFGWVKWFKQGEELLYQTYGFLNKNIIRVIRNISKDLSDNYEISYISLEYKNNGQLNWISGNNFQSFRNSLNSIITDETISEASGTNWAWYWIPMKGLKVRQYDPNKSGGEHESMAGELGLDDIDELPRGQFWISDEDKKQTSHTSYNWTPMPPKDIHLQLRKYFKIPKDWSHYSNDETKWLIGKKNMAENTDYEIEMASGQLKKIIDLATNTLNYIQNKSELDSWIQDKISVSAHNMEAIFDYFHYSEEKIEEKIVKKNKKYYLLSKKTGKNLGGPYDSKEQASQRERQVQFFKHLNK